MVSDFGSTRWCKKCDGEIVRKGEAITMYEGKKICRCIKSELNEQGDNDGIK